MARDTPVTHQAGNPMRNITEATHKDGTKTWRVRFRLSPGRASNPVTETFPTLEAAVYFRDLVDRVGGVNARKLLDTYDDSDAPEIYTLDQALEEYCEHVETHAARGTAPEYRKVAKRMFLRQIPGETPIGAITRQQIESWIAWQRQQVTQRKKLYSAKTIANAHGILSSALQYQVELGRIPYNPARGVKIPKDTATKQIAFLTSAQVDAIARECGKYEVFVRFLYVTGLRFGEATALTAEDIDLDGGMVYVRRAWKKENSWKKYLGSPKSEKGVRAVSIPQSLCGLLEPLVEAASPWVFPSPRIPSKPLNASHFRERVWRPAVEAAGVKPAPRVHDLRHSCASRLIQEDIPLPVVQARLGHESIKTTVDTYGHVTAEQAREAANVFE